jgi:NAD(P)-dependent dehydrogenase (short-subunit alcohol dehydrogenase family)
MKIAITGHTAGIGAALAKEYSSAGHKIYGLSRTTGQNIKDTQRIAKIVETCDMFINNAQDGFAQTELLYEMYRRWQGQNKHIVVIGTQMTLTPYPTYNLLDMIPYYVQKQALEEMTKQLRQLGPFPLITVVKPGATGTSTQAPGPKADVDLWAKNLVKCLEVDDSLRVSEITLGVNYTKENYYGNKTV